MGKALSPVQAEEIKELRTGTMLIPAEDVYFVSIKYASSQLEGNPPRRRVEKEVKAAVVAHSITDAYKRLVAHVSAGSDFVAVIAWEQIHFGAFLGVTVAPL
jgi:hypothetical protein